MSWSVFVPFLLGAATGGWWSRRRAVHRAVSAALATAQATALAQGGHVYIGGSGGLSGFDLDRAALHGAAGYDHHHDLDHAASGAAADELGGFGLRRGGVGDAAADLGRGVDARWQGVDLGLLREAMTEGDQRHIPAWGPGRAPRQLPPPSPQQRAS